MLRWVIVLIGIYTVMLSSAARAEAGWTDEVSLVELIPTGRHYYELQLTGKRNPSGCREKNSFYINYDARGADKMFDLLFDSIKTEMRLRVYVTGVCNLKGYAEISSVSVSPK